MKKFIILLIPILFWSCDPKDLERLLERPLSNADIAEGLKQALRIGTNESVDYLSQEDGFYSSPYKILLPEEARTVTDRLKVIPGFNNLEDEIIRKINQGAEDAASKAAPIFIDAIKEITFQDVMNILRGDNHAATNYLENRTYSALYTEFKPIIINSLNKFNALDAWSTAVNKYNTVPFVSKVNPDLADHVTTEALDGLFALVAVKEEGIRTDISQRTSDLLRRVFAKQDNP